MQLVRRVRCIIQIQISPDRVIVSLGLDSLNLLPLFFLITHLDLRLTMLNY